MMHQCAQIAYEAYAAYLDWKDYQGNPLPEWESVRWDIKEAWAVGIQAVFDVQGRGDMS